MSTNTKNKLVFDPEERPEVYPVKGVPVENGDHPGVRQEIRDLNKDPDMWNLYLLGLWQFQLVPTDNPFSYYRIAGIHGLPHAAWPAHNQEIIKRKVQDNIGFCTHTSILFLPWHRPYLALFEAVLQRAMLHVAELYTEAEGKQRYLAAAKKFRIPYWDWARQDLDRFPKEATDSASASVKMPESLYDYYHRENPRKYKLQKDGTVTIPNPLFSWQYLKDTDEGIKDLSFGTKDLDETTRWYPEPTQNDPTPKEQSADEQADELADVLTPFYQDATAQGDVVKSTANLGERLNILLTGYDNFAGVSHDKWASVEEKNKAGNAFGSFEDIHNSMHAFVGGFGTDTQGRKRNGQMSHVPQAAFDPIFWLHHCNIDRALAIWQVLHDGRTDKRLLANNNIDTTWVTEHNAAEGTWVTKAEGIENAETELLPFYKDNSTFYTSNDVRDTAALGYAYPETQSWLFHGDTARYKKDVNDKLSKLYPLASLPRIVMASRDGDTTDEDTLRQRALALNILTAAEKPNTFSTSIAIAAKIAQQESTAPIAIAPQLEDALPDYEIPDVAPLRPRSLADLIKGDTYLEWLVNVKAPKHARNGGYQVHVFLGEVPPEEPTSLYVLSPYQVGSFVPLGQSKDTECEKCKQDQLDEVTITGQIPLTIALVERYFAGKLDSLEERHVIPYLQKNLHWEVIDEHGERRQGERNIVPGLLVGVVSNEVTLPGPGREYPVYAPNNRVYPEITTKADGSDGRGEGTGLTEETRHFQ